mmetsp:Transcript_10278/g.22810  ORF Transcript_10278/g.22810 Transcript_10278/m.22810 type:complete len:280 (+) Transcript_10278:693-1532(+)
MARAGAGSLVGRLAGGLFLHGGAAHPRRKAVFPPVPPLRPVADLHPHERISVFSLDVVVRDGPGRMQQPRVRPGERDVGHRPVAAVREHGLVGAFVYRPGGFVPLQKFVGDGEVAVVNHGFLDEFAAGLFPNDGPEGGDRIVFGRLGGGVSEYFFGIYVSVFGRNVHTVAHDDMFDGRAIPGMVQYVRKVGVPEGILELIFFNEKGGPLFVPYLGKFCKNGPVLNHFRLYGKILHDVARYGGRRRGPRRCVGRLPLPTVLHHDPYEGMIDVPVDLIAEK